jgi:hypothetical protein
VTLPSKQKLLIFTILELLLLSQWVTAEQRIDHLYEARVPIESRDNAAQQAAMERGLATVLNKISGYSGASAFPELQASLTNASALVSEFGLQSMQVPAEDGISVQVTDALYMRFVSSQVDQLIRRFEIPVWPANRAEILFLVAAEMGGVPQLLTPATHPATYVYLERVAFDRGFALRTLEQGDLNSLSVSANAVWTLDELALRATFATLPVDQIVVIRLRPGAASPMQTSLVASYLTEQNLSYFGDFSAVENELAYQRNIEGEKFVDAFEAALNDYLDQLSLKTAFVASSVLDTRVTLEIEGVPDFTAYRQLRDYIQNLEQIESVKLLRLSMDKLVLQIEFQSGIELLNSSLINSGFLVALDIGLTALSASKELKYQYRPGVVSQ